ncbi:MAG: carbohydrate ABC transporter permease [Saccharofermentanales bacterium]
MNITSSISKRKYKKRFFKKAKVNRSKGGNFLVFIGIFILGSFIALPIVYAIGNAFKPLDELWLFPPPLLPNNPTLRNFADLFQLLTNSWVPMSRYLFNTIFITIAGTAGHVIFASMCAYALAKHKFPGANFMFSIIFLSLMFTGAVTGIPNYLIMVNLGWVNTYQALIVPAFGSAFGMFLMKQFMTQIPDSYIEAARIDGAKETRIFWKIIMPSVKPAWLTLIVFSVQALWNLGSNVFIYSEQLKTFPYAIGQIVSAGIARAGVGSAVTLVMLIVPVTTFVFTQSKIIETMASSGIKE